MQAKAYDLASRLDLSRLGERLLPGPYVIGATGGSGTRVVARIVRRGGLYIGAHRNESEDALLLAGFLERWINSFLEGTARWRQPVPASLQEEMVRELEAVMHQHLAPLRLDRGWRAWGWKAPRSLFLLPFWHEQFPWLKFLHVVRDGRDMAFSTNQNQLQKHGEQMLKAEERDQPFPLRSLALWCQINTMVADYGEAHLGEHYLRLRFEDLCHHPQVEIKRLFRFFDLRGDVRRIAREEVQPPESLGRWRQQDEEIVAALHRIGSVSLRRLGYSVD